MYWYCEDHPDKEMGHDGCTHAGIPECARMDMLILHRRNALQELKEVRAFTDVVITGLLKRIEELETLNEN